MTPAEEDIFGQIDALLGKRSPDVLTEKNLQGDDFPTLTEVIKTNGSVSQSTIPVQNVAIDDMDYRQVERRVCERRQTLSFDMPRIVSSAISDSDLDALESRLLELIRSHHASLEKSLRLIIQQELERLKSD